MTSVDNGIEGLRLDVSQGQTLVYLFVNLPDHRHVVSPYDVKTCKAETLSENILQTQKNQFVYFLFSCQEETLA